MHTMQKLRAALGFSQAQLAVYLGITHSLLSLAETGIRSLPGAASVKLALLQKKLSNNVVHQPKHLQKQVEKDLACIRTHTNQSTLQAQLYKKELEAMK